ncbi:MAG TPA: amidase [Thermomicrobiales bacterium]|jgi:aspartyl-tRNA(Asn)/glutamyl-tRNA(Gln) amidotransferase subunit A
MLQLVEIAEQIRTRAVSPVEVVEASLRRADELSPSLNAYITVLGERAVAEAREAEREIAVGNYRGPLHGVPVSVKDIFATKGVRTTSGSRILADFVPDEDATVVRRLREAGAILIAKANTFQFACSPPHPDFGPTRNPWDLSRTTRGSSSGSAAAVAAGIDYGSIGSDTGGSIRVPAAFTGIAGLKPTIGRVGRFGMQTVSWTMDHAGPLARSVADLAVLLAAVAGIDDRDRQSIDAPLAAGRGDTERLDGLVVGVLADFMGDDVEPDVRSAVETGIDVLRDRGAEIRHLSIPELGEPALTAHGQIMWPEAAYCHREWFPSRLGDYTEFSQHRFAEARTAPAIDYLHGLEERRRIRAVVAAVQREVDLFVLPTAPMVATPLESMDPGADERMAELAALGTYNSPFDLTGQPAITVPCGFSRDGLPIGLQIVGRDREDETVIRAAQGFEASTEWHSYHPKSRVQV